MKFTARTNGQRRIEWNMDAINSYLSRWKPGTEVSIEITRQSAPSDPMRKYYFGVVLPMFMDCLGYDVDEQDVFHRQLKIVYFQVEPDKRGIYREKDIPSVFANDSEMNMETRINFMEWAIRKAAQNGCVIPPAGGETEIR